MIEITEFQAGYNSLVDAFAKKYYGEDAYAENKLIGEDRWFHPIKISDHFWTIQEIYQAMMLDAPEDKVLGWYDFYMGEFYQYNKINFYNYLKLNN